MPKGDPTVIGAEIRRRRRQLDISQTVLAERAGLDFGTVSRIERGKNGIPKIATVTKLDQALDAKGELVFVATGVTPDVSDSVHTQRASAGETRGSKEGARLNDVFGTIRYRWEQLSMADRELALDRIDEILKSFKQGDAIGLRGALIAPVGTPGGTAYDTPGRLRTSHW